MTGPGPILVYSKYADDLQRFRRILEPALAPAEIGYAGTPEQAEPHLASVEVLYGWGFSSAMLARMPKLRWVQKMGAGVEDVLEAPQFRTGVVLTRTDGRLIAPRMVEYVVAMILQRTLKLREVRKAQREGQWLPYFEVGSIRQLTIGVAGLGEIGNEIARTLRGLGADVVGWRRSNAPTDAVRQLFAGREALARFVAGCDVVVLVLPLTSQTRGILSGSILRAFRPGAHLINIGRGGVLDETALMEAIDAGIIAHTTLDVFATEPLPPAHPFWRHPGVTVTPHICGPLIPEDVAPHFLANYAAFAAGKPLRNVIELDRQY